MTISINDLPHYLYHEIEYADGRTETYKFFLSINRTVFGQWAVGYVRFPTGPDDHEMAIPQLVLNNADTLEEAAIRLQAKLERYNKQKQ